jgi:hypothetical protein
VSDFIVFQQVPGCPSFLRLNNIPLYVLVSFLFTVIKYMRKTTQERKDLGWLIVSEISVHLVSEGVTEHSSSYHCNQETKIEEGPRTRYDLHRHIPPVTYFSN